MGKVVTTKYPSTNRLYVPKAIQNVMELHEGNIVSWYLGTDLEVRRMLNDEVLRQELVVIHVRNK